MPGTPWRQYFYASLTDTAMTKQKIFLLFLAVFFIAFHGFGQVSYKTQATKMSVTGSSTLHEWTSEVSQIEWTGLITIIDHQIEAKNVTITIPVKGIKSEHGKMMDNKTYESFKSDKNPNLTYKVTGSKTKTIGNDTFMEVTGVLTMAGVSKTISLDVKSKTLPNGNMVLTASQKIKMTEFKMEPPTAMMGSIKVGDEVTVNFEITLTTDKI
jgi:polyisoprenoid-binding protein YceI